MDPSELRYSLVAEVDAYVEARMEQLEQFQTQI